MIDTKKKANLLELMVQMGRGPPHLKGFIKFLKIISSSILFLDPDKPFREMTDTEIVAHLKKLAGKILKIFYFSFY
jgi:hypothetical protein